MIRGVYSFLQSIVMTLQRPVSGLYATTTVCCLKFSCCCKYATGAAFGQKNFSFSERKE